MNMRNRTAIVEQALESVDDYVWRYQMTIRDIEEYDRLIGEIEQERTITAQPSMNEDTWVAYMEERKLMVEELDDYTDRLQKVQDLVAQLRAEEELKYPQRF